MLVPSRNRAARGPCGSERTGMIGKPALAWGTALVAAGLLGAGGVLLGLRHGPARVSGDTVAPEIALREVPAETRAVAAPSKDAAPSDAAPAEEAAETPAGADPATPATPTPADPPRIDTFRLDAEGRMLVAGRAEPGWQTEILLDGRSLGAVRADAGGRFAEFLTLDQSAAPRVLALAMRAPDGTGTTLRSTQEVIIAPSPPGTAANAPGAGTAAAPAEASASAGAEAGAAGPAEGERPAPAVLLADAEGVELLQPPDGGAGAGADAGVALDAISYAEGGEVGLSGRAEGGAHVRLYLDNRPVGVAEVSGDGRWRWSLPEVDTGRYTLRVDELDAEGEVTARIETPLRREGDIVLAETAAAEGGGTEITAVTVVPGATLWAISRAAYGEGVLYVRVFDANRAHIRDPDLIYPGQVFTIPQ